MQGPGLAAVATRSIGASVVAGLEGVSQSAATVFQASSTLAGMALVGAFLAVTVLLDLGLIIYHSCHVSKSMKDKTSGKAESKTIAKWYVIQIEDMLKSKPHRFNWFNIIVTIIQVNLILLM